MSAARMVPDVEVIITVAGNQDHDKAVVVGTVLLVTIFGVIVETDYFVMLRSEGGNC